MLKVYSSVQDHQQRIIYKRFWLNELKSKGILDWRLKSIWLKALLESQKHSASEESAPEDDVIRSQFSRSKVHQKPICSEAKERWQSTVYGMYNHYVCACPCNHQLCIVSSIHDKNNSNNCRLYSIFTGMDLKLVS